MATVYFGGGTPSLLDPSDIGALIGAFGAGKGGGRREEVTLEANPDDVNEENAAAWAGAGINRVSLGVQSFHPGVLEWMHRTHRANDAMRAVGILKEQFESVSVDLIFGLPETLDHDFSKDLNSIIGLAPDHISVYGLTVEGGTPLGKWVAGGKTKVVSDERYTDEFMLCHRLLKSAGYDHYEISNFARPGAQSAHNSCYWEAKSYVGLGPSAHSFDATCGRRSWNLKNWAEYEAVVARGLAPESGGETLGDDQKRLETLYLALRTSAGVSTGAINRGRVDSLVESGMAEVVEENLVLTLEGWLKIDEIILSLTT